MNVKGYLSTLIIILTLFGIKWEPSAVPNQEIVVQFDDTKVTLDEAQRAIASVKQRLVHIGAEDIQVTEEADGRLRITYFSRREVAAVQRLLSEGEKLAIGAITHQQTEERPEFPTENDSNTYELNVCEIQKQANVDPGLHGYIIEIKSGNDSYVTPVVYFDKNEINIKESNRIETLAYAVYKYLELRIETASYTIPEVRAGPGIHGIS